MSSASHNSLVGDEAADEQDEDSSDVLLTSSSDHLTSSVGYSPDTPRGFINTCFKFVSWITIEPVIFLNTFSWMFQGTLGTNMLIEKVCIMNFNYTENICSNISNHAKEQNSVQEVVTKLNMYQQLVGNLPAIIFVLFLGSWSDKNGRKIPLLMPLIGSIVKTIIYIINVYFWSIRPEYIIFTAIPTALSGGFPVMVMSSFSYISDISSVQSRTTRVAVVDMMLAAGAPVGLLFSIGAFNSLGYLGVYLISLLIFILSTIYVIVRIEETRGPNAKYQLGEELRQNNSIPYTQLFDLRHLQSAINSLKKERENYGRFKIISLIITLCLIVFTFGSVNMDYLFVRKMFHWNYTVYCTYSAISICIGIIGCIIALPLLSLWLRIDDEILGLLGSISKAGDYGLRLLADQGWYMYADV